MDPVGYLPAVIALIVAILSAALINRRTGAPLDQGRFASIDGLRGYLAFFVFLHHSSIWFYYLKTDQWKVPPSNLYTHFGQSSVAFFFMITGFLFFSKVIDGRTKKIDWGRLFVGRFMRLVPLYLFAMLLLFLIVTYLSRGVLNESIPSLLKNVIRWLGFTVLGSPDLNGVRDTSTIIARVTWSLPYEWFFYFSLPVLAIFVRVKSPLPYFVIGCASIVAFTLWRPNIYQLLAFFGGIFASFAVRFDKFCRFAEAPVSSYLLVGILFVVVIYFPSAYEWIPLVLLTTAFILVAGGSNLFGLLVSPTSRFLGEMAYSIYLLHGIFLFVAINFVVGRDYAKLFSPMHHWVLVVSMTPLLIVGCFLTYSFIEKPAMQRTNSVTTWIRVRLKN